MKNPKRFLIIALLLILIGSAVAGYTQTAGGNIEVRDVRWVAPSGTMMSALLYIPKGVTAENPAPGIVATHGYFNSRETQDGFAIEFARRGYVVLAPDETGHGYSDPPAFADGFGGVNALAYMHTLSFVDQDNIGLEGHSMGGWASLAAASAFPDGYKAIVLEGSSTGAPFAADGTPEWPRNLAVVYSLWDEFSAFMWGTPTAAGVVDGEKLKAAFGTTETVEIEHLYGSIEDGTGRMFYQPRTTHPGDHLSTVAIGDAIKWFQMTLDGDNGLDPANQTWYWKEIGTLIALIGMVLLLFPVGALLLQTKYFAELEEKPAASKASKGWGWWVAALITFALGPVTLFWGKDLPTILGIKASAWFPQEFTTSLAAWMVFLGLVTILLFVLWHYVLNKEAKATGDNYGLTWARKLNWGKIGKSFLLAFLVVFAGYFTLILVDFFFKTDFRFWVLAVKPMSPLQLRITFSYIIPLAFYFLILGTVMFAQLRRDDWSMTKAMLVNIGILMLGYLGLIAYQYIPLLSGGTMAIVGQELWSIIAFQFLPLMSIAAAVYTWFSRKTGHVYVAGFIMAMLITWIVVAEQVTHFAF